MATTTSASTGIEALHRLKSTDPPLYLTPSPDLSKAARKALEHLFSSLKPYTPKSPFDRLLVEDEFDAEQIWQQIDLQSQPLISGIRRQVNKFENNPEELSKILKDGENYYGEKREVGLEGERENEAEEDVDDDDADDDEEEEEDDEVEDEEIEDEETEGGGGLEDKFLNIEEMKKFMEDDEAREYGLDQKKPGNNEVYEKYDDDNEEEEGEEEENDDDDDGLGVLELTGEEETSDVENARYEDFFVAKKKENQKKKPKVIEEAEEFDIDNNEKGEDTDIGDGSDVMESDGKTKMDNLSTYEKLLLEQRAKIKEVERENLKAKLWTMQGEVTAAKRPKNSALEVDLDWERNAKPPPVITEQVSHSIEELILKRISEGHFDDVQRVASLPSKAPREAKELDENKSKKGLGDMYADEYAQKTGLVSQALSFSDEQKKEASLLFKKLCLKLDALSHFHFTPKPVIEDMSVQTNVPALAMEEIAPLAVSDAAMLAPEEVFSGKGDIKEEAELTQAERKRRRANKKRKFKAENADRMMAKKARESTLPNSDGNKES